MLFRLLSYSKNRGLRGTHASVLILVVMNFVGCIISLPAPTIEEGMISSSIDLPLLCKNANKLIELQTTGAESFTAVIECRSEIIVIAVLNAFGIRVSTLTVERNGAYHYEVSYLGKKWGTSEKLLTEIIHANLGTIQLQKSSGHTIP